MKKKFTLMELVVVIVVIFIVVGGVFAAIESGKASDLKQLKEANYPVYEEKILV